ncbi:LysR family transcriptional regulator [soil metagenome]
MSVSSHLPDLPSLRLLADVARLGSIGAAGREIGISQQSASERLKSMEALTGLALVQRTRSGSALTAAGRLLVEWSGELLTQADQVEDALRTLRTERSRELHVHASMTVAEHLLPRWLVILRRETSTTATLRATNSYAVVEAVTSGEADLGFVEGPGDLGALSSAVVGTDTLVLVAAPEDPWCRRRTPLTAATIAARPLTSRERGSGTRLAWERALLGGGAVARAPEAELTTNAAVLASVAAGGGPAFVSRHVAERDLASGLVRQIPTQGLDLHRVLTAVWVGGARPPAGPVRDLVAIAQRR